MGICLICTLGDRDIQFNKNDKEVVEKLLNINLNENRDDDNYYVIIPQQFRVDTKKILDNYDKIEEYIQIPLIDKVIDKIKDKKLEKIYLIATDQEGIASKQYSIKDTTYEAEIIKKKLSKKYGLNVEIVPARFNAKDLEKWFKLIVNLFNEVLKDENNEIVVEFSGGMGETREAIRLASLFNNKITVYEIINNEPVDMNTYFYEQKIAKEKVKDLVKNYIYTGALAFKDYLSEEIVNALEYLNYRLNFDFENANKIAKDNEIVKKFNDRLEKIRNENNTIEKLKYLILELLDNMEIELKRGEYANFLARVYRLEEAVGQYLILKWLSDKNCEIHYNKNNDKNKENDNKEKEQFRKKPEYLPVIGINRHLANYFNHLKDGGYENEHEEYLANEINKLNELIKGGFKIGDNLNTRNIEEIIKIMYNENSSEERKMLNNIFAMYKYYHNGKGKNLRNNTIIAHGFRGVNKDMINEMLAKNGINKDIEEFFTEDIKNKFYKIIGKDDEENIFDKINSEIIEYLNKI